MVHEPRSSDCLREECVSSGEYNTYKHDSKSSTVHTVYHVYNIITILYTNHLHYDGNRNALANKETLYQLI
jgi:hypothetical protein